MLLGGIGSMPCRGRQLGASHPTSSRTLRVNGVFFSRTSPRIPGRRFTISNAASSVEADTVGDLPLPPGTLGLPFIGETLENFSNEGTFHSKRIQQHGKIYKTCLLGTDVAVIHDKEEVKRLLQAEGRLVRPYNWDHLMKLLGKKSLLFMSGEKHVQNRRLLSLAFNREAIRYYMPTLVEVADRRLNAWADAQSNVRGIAECKDLAFDVATVVLISDMTKEAFEGFREDYETMTKGIPVIPVAIPGSRYYAAVQARRRIKDRVALYVKEATAAAAEGRQREGLPSALDLMVNATDEEGNRVSEEEIIDQCVLQLLAGHETTGTTMARMLQALQNNPRVLALLREEQAAVVAERGPEFTPDTLDAMPYAEAVIKEIMRRWPTVSQVSRQAITDIQVGEYKVPAGWQLFLMLDGTIRDIDEFSGDRAEFRPERWLDLKRDPKGYYPFGEGPHICLGMALAKAEMMVVLAKLARDFEWRLADPNEEWFGFMGPVNGLPLWMGRLHAKH